MYKIQTLNNSINTEKRKSISKKVGHSFSGGGGYTDANEKSCKAFFERTKSFEIIRWQKFK